MEVFRNDDNGYLSWMQQNPNGFVVNTQRSNNSLYYVLHRSGCHHVTTTASLKNGAYTAGKYIKVCANSINDIEAWLAQNRKNFTGIKDFCSSCDPMGNKIIKFKINLFPDTFPETELEEIYEGAKKQVIVNAYERNSKARKACLNHYGYSCTACEFDFEKIYGKVGRGFIHVHHLVQLASIGKSYKVNPITDLRPVCPNCHSMLHQRNPPFTIEELKDILSINRL